jgi:hypothetical protein
MGRICHHRNVVRLVGLVLEPRLGVVMELMRGGRWTLTALTALTARRQVDRDCNSECSEC